MRSADGELVCERLHATLDEVRSTPAEAVLADKVAEADRAVPTEVRSYLEAWPAKRAQYPPATRAGRGFP